MRARDEQQQEQQQPLTPAFASSATAAGLLVLQPVDDEDAPPQAGSASASASFLLPAPPTPAQHTMARPPPHHDAASDNNLSAAPALIGSSAAIIAGDDRAAQVLQHHLSQPQLEAQGHDAQQACAALGLAPAAGPQLQPPPRPPDVTASRARTLPAPTLPSWPQPTAAPTAQPAGAFTMAPAATMPPAPPFAFFPAAAHPGVCAASIPALLEQQLACLALPQPQGTSVAAGAAPVAFPQLPGGLALLPPPRPYAMPPAGLAPPVLYAVPAGGVVPQHYLPQHAWQQQQWVQPPQPQPQLRPDSLAALLGMDKVRARLDLTHPARYPSAISGRLLWSRLLWPCCQPCATAGGCAARARVKVLPPWPPFVFRRLAYVPTWRPPAFAVPLARSESACPACVLRDESAGQGAAARGRQLHAQPGDGGARVRGRGDAPGGAGRGAAGARGGVLPGAAEVPGRAELLARARGEGAGRARQRRC